VTRFDNLSPFSQLFEVTGDFFFLAKSPKILAIFFYLWNFVIFNLIRPVKYELYCTDFLFFEGL
jgi:hypothetical protein